MYEESEIEELAPWLVIIITLIGGGLRVFLIANKGLWLDETLSIWVSSHSVVEMLQWIAKIDQHPPLYYLLLHYWIELNGNTPYDVRLLSALFGSGPSAANFENTCIPGVPLGRLNQTPKKILAIRLSLAINLDGEPGYPAIV